MARDYYDVLGVSRDAGPDELQQAFRRLARANHPDVNKDPGAEERFKEINEAYSALSDPELRKRYDRFGEDFRQVPEDWEDRVGSGGGGSAARPHRARREAWSGGGVDDADVGGYGGGLRGSRHRGPARRHVRWPRPRPAGARSAGADQEAELPLTRGGGLPRRSHGDHAQRPGRARAATRSRSRRGSPTASGSGWPAREAAGCGGGPAGDLYLVVRLQPHPALPSATAGTSRSTCRSPRGRRRSARRCRSPRPAARRR